MSLDYKNAIAKRVAQDFQDGNVVNLGIGIPGLAANYVPEGVKVYLHSENGILGCGPKPTTDKIDKDYYDASSQYCTVIPGGYVCNSADSFALVRNGSLDITVLGGLQIDQKGNIANWCIPGKNIIGLGGAMDLVFCAKHVWVAMTHTNAGQPKLFEKCTFPLTGVGCVERIYTEMAVIDVTPDGFLLREIAPGLTMEDVQKATAAPLLVADDLKVIDIA